ncbi:class I SAM-dependent methyltransferase, partial [Oleiphilus sp. HI0125]|uniref:class I SAM-dependent methyltransferase n=3 Tax=Oleiphilus sp. HI0125 TaxID=1822266 RepID=UPI000AFF505C
KQITYLPALAEKVYLMLPQEGSITVHQSTRLSPTEAADLARRVIQINQDYNTINAALSSSDAIRTTALNQLLVQIEQVIEQDIPGAATLNLAGRISFDLDLTELANEYFQRAGMLEPSNANYLLNNANAQALLGNYSQAQALFNKVLDLEPSSMPGFTGIAFCLLETKQYDAAFLHYRSILAHGHTSTEIHHQITECIENLQCDTYTIELELLLNYLLRLEDIDTRRLIEFAGQLVTHKYDLTNPEAALDIDVLAQDELLLCILETGVVPSVHFEELVTLLRLSIFSECAINQTLRTELQACAIAIGVYASHTDYALIATEEEQNHIKAIQLQIATNIGYEKADIDDISGALILLGMYEALYVQSFSFDLLRYDLEDWPIAMQSLLDASLYQLSKEHHARYTLFGQTMAELLENGLPRSKERWAAIKSPQKKDFYATLKQKLAPTLPPSSWQGKTVRVLLLACGSGQKAFDYANQFTNVSVLGADVSQIDMAYAHMRTQHSACDNLEFAVADYALPPQDIEKFDYIEFGQGFDFSKLDAWINLLNDDGVARINCPGTEHREITGVLTELVKARGMQANLDNIRLIRSSILLEKESGLWNKLLESPFFYSASGCRDILFNDNAHFYTVEQAFDLIQNAGLISVFPRPSARRAAQAEQMLDVFVRKLGSH